MPCFNDLQLLGQHLPGFSLASPPPRLAVCLRAACAPQGSAVSELDQLPGTRDCQCHHLQKPSCLWPERLCWLHFPWALPGEKATQPGCRASSLLCSCEVGRATSRKAGGCSGRKCRGLTVPWPRGPSSLGKVMWLSPHRPPVPPQHRVGEGQQGQPIL